MVLTPADLLARVGMPEPTNDAESEAVLKRAIEVLLKNDNISGYGGVLPSASKKNPWQAKPYCKEKKRYLNLGSYETPEEAAKIIVIWMHGGTPTPPTPKKDRNSRGMGRRKRDRSSHGKGACLLSYPYTSVASVSHSAVLCSLVELTSAPASTGRRSRSGRSRRCRSTPPSRCQRQWPLPRRRTQWTAARRRRRHSL